MNTLIARTKAFALAVVRFCGRLPERQEHCVIGRQLLRAATSVGANYRASQRAKSTADFLSKLSIVEEEADECLYWLELLAELPAVPRDDQPSLHRESEEILRMIVAAKKTTRLAQARSDR